MKKILTFVLFIVLITSLFSCNIVDKITGKGNTVTDNGTNENNGSNDNTTQEPMSDEDKLNLMFSDLKSSIKVENSSLQIPEIIDKYASDLDFSLEDIEFNGEKSPASIIFKDNTLYISSAEYAEQIIRFSEHGILTVSESNDEVTSALTTYDQLLKDLPSVDIQAILDSLVIKQGDLQKTEKEHVYTVNRSLLLRIGKALSGDSSFTIDKATAPTITLDMTAYDNAVNDRVIKLSIYDKTTKETTEVILSLNDQYDEENNKRLTFSVRSTDVKIDGHIIFADELKNVKFDATITEEGQEVHSQFNCIFKDNVVTNILLCVSCDAFELELNANLSNDGNVSNLRLDLKADIEENQAINFSLEYDSALASKVGENVISARLLFIADNENSVTITFRVETEAYTKENAQYTVMLEVPNGAESIIGTAKIYSPAKSTPKVSKKASLYLNHGSKILFSYPTYLTKAENLNNQMMAILNSGNFSSLKTNWVTYDSDTGIYFLTSISSANGGYVSTTYSSPDAFKYAYLYPQNLGGFKKEGMSLAEKEARRLAELILQDVPSDATGSLIGTFYTYTYIENYDVYLLVESHPYPEYAVLISEPSEEQTYNGAKIHKLSYDESGKVKIHDYQKSTSDTCYLNMVCSHCSAKVGMGTYEHSPITDISETDGSGKTLWDFVYCEKCLMCEMNIYKDGLTLTLVLEEMSDSILYDIRRHAGMEDFSLSTDDFAHSLVITRIEFNGEFSAAEPIEIAIPELSDYCDYSIIGVDDAMYSYSNNTPLYIILPEGIEFINEHAFMSCEFVYEISLPSTLKFIGRSAFYNCENLESVVFNCDNIYIGEDAFGNTSVEITG